MKIDIELAKHIVSLRGNSHFDAVVSAMAEEAENIIEKIVLQNTTPDQLMFLKGQANALTMFLKTFANAVENIDKYEKK